MTPNEIVVDGVTYIKKPSSFFSLPKPPELTEEEIKRFGLLMNTGSGTKVNKPVWQGNDVVWATAVNEFTPTYRVYYAGTNCLILLKYFPTSKTWKNVSVDDIDNLYGFIWTLITDIYSEERKAHWKVVDENNLTWSIVTELKRIVTGLLTWWRNMKLRRFERDFCVNCGHHRHMHREILCEYWGCNCKFFVERP